MAKFSEEDRHLTSADCIQYYAAFAYDLFYLVMSKRSYIINIMVFMFNLLITAYVKFSVQMVAKSPCLLHNAVLFFCHYYRYECCINYYI